MVRAGLGYLSGCDAASLGTSAQAEALIGLEQAGAQHTAARARMLAAFSTQRGHQADGQYGPASWLRAFTNVTNGAAGAAVTWARRLAAHPLVAAALTAGQLSASWAKALCEWTDQLPEDRRADADRILLTSLSQPPGLGRTPGWSHPTCAKPSSSGTRNAGSPAASSPPRSARSTTSSSGPRAAPPPSATWHFSAGTTTSSSSTAGAGKSPATPTEPPPPPHPTDASSTPTDHPPP